MATKSSTKTKKKTTKTKVSTTKAPKATTSLPKKEKRAEIIARGLKLIKPLQDANIPASLYSQGPDGSGVFALSKGSGIPGSLLIWPGSSTAKITIKTDKTKRQAVIRVVEEARTLTHSGFLSHVSRYVTYSHSENSYILIQPWNGLGELFPVNLPSGTTYSIEKQTPVVKGNKNGVSFTIKATVSASDESFLVGIDETAVFVSALPRAVDSVDDAHDALRPPSVPEDALRHGEFFLIPANKSELQRIKNVPSYSIVKNAGLETFSTHKASERALVTSYAPHRTFVRGKVYDTRSFHHSDIELDDWHRVVRNLEKTTPATTRVRRWD